MANAELIPLQYQTGGASYAETYAHAEDTAN